MFRTQPTCLPPPALCPLRGTLRGPRHASPQLWGSRATRSRLSWHPAFFLFVFLGARLPVPHRNILLPSLAISSPPASPGTFRAPLGSKIFNPAIHFSHRSSKTNTPFSPLLRNLHIGGNYSFLLRSAERILAEGASSPHWYPLLFLGHRLVRREDSPNIAEAQLSRHLCPEGVSGRRQPHRACERSMLFQPPKDPEGVSAVSA
jgi:hypothetical protein